MDVTRGLDQLISVAWQISQYLVAWQISQYLVAYKSNHLLSLMCLLRKKQKWPKPLEA